MENRMKRQILGALTLAFLLATSLAGCQGKPSQTAQTSSLGEFETENAVADGIQRMHTYDYTDTLRLDGHTYVCTIHREADESLDHVTDEEGTQYADNRYTLSIRRDGQPCFERQFTKGSFASHLSAEFQQKGILDGMMCDHSLPGLSFAVSVTLPQSDMVEPLLLRVDTAGGIVIERDTRSENDFEEEQE